MLFILVYAILMLYMIARERRPSAVDMVKHDNPAYHVWRIITYKRFYDLAFDLGNDKYGI